MSIGSGGAGSRDEDDLESMRERGAARTRIIAWVIIIAMVIGGGGATVFALLQG